MAEGVAFRPLAPSASAAIFITSGPAMEQPSVKQWPSCSMSFQRLMAAVIGTCRLALKGCKCQF